MKKKYYLLLLFILTVGCSKSCNEKKEREVYFISPESNVQAYSPIKVEFGVKGMTVRPALEDVNDKSSGHHHILVDHPKGYIEKGQAVPVDKRHIHYGQGQTSDTLILTPGVHTLSLQFADGAHISYGKEMSKTITVTIKDDTNG